MWKKMYNLALRLLHQPIVLRHISGWVYHGLLVKVTKKGLYLMPFGDPVLASGHAAVAGETAVWQVPRGADSRPAAEPVVFGPLFFPFAVIASFAAGSLFGAAAARPPYPYYPPYGGYPYSPYTW
ncbi:MAG: hypothetical protein IRZ33_11780 [Alicyclobacillaceae bacterium]|nr:hypothetical protein [Alicyclobacillaceae bacterium]